MSNENKLDLSQVSVRNLFNEDAPSNIPEPDTAEDVTPDPEPEVEPTDVAEPEAEAEAAPEAAPVTDEPLDTPQGSDGDVDEKGEGGEPESSVIDVLREKLGYTVEGEFNDDYDGVASFTKTVADEIAKEQLDTMFAQFPDVQQYIQFRYNGGDPQQYFQATSPSLDYSSLEISEEDVSTQRMVVEQFLNGQGYSQEEISETVQEYMDAGILKKHADRNLGKLQAGQKRHAEEILVNQQREAEENRTRVQSQWENIRTTIDAGQVRGFQIPQSDKNKFFSWMSDAVDNDGRTQRSLDREVMDVESQVAMEYLLWKKFDLNKLVSNTQNTKKAQNLKTRLQKTQTATKRMKGGPGGYQAPKTLPSLKDLF